MLVAGTKLGPYEVIARLGAGGMGEVYRARDARLDRQVAIKVLPAAVAEDAGRVARFEQEAKAIAALSHPNVLAVFDTGLVDTGRASARQLYVVTELLEGETLGERLRSGALPVRKSIDIAAQIARGLAAAHERGFVHRDLKPDNVFVTTAGHVKILDFGLARPVPVAEHGGLNETRVAMTDAGTILGTAGYMAPEQVQARQVDARADLFALGVVLYEMLAGRRAFLRDTPVETLTAVLNDDPPDPTTLRADVAPALGRIVHHCLEKSPDQRFQTARDVAFALEALSGSGATTRLGTFAHAPRFGITRERLAWVTIVAGLAAALVWLWAAPAAPPTSFTAPHRTTLLLPTGVTLPLYLDPAERFAISPDGTRLAFVGVAAGGGTRLWLQSLNEDGARVVEDSEGAAAPFWSPDSRIVAFRLANQMMKMDVAGGRPVAFGPMQHGAAWGRRASGEDVIVTAFDTDQAMVLRGMSLGGGTTIDLSTPLAGVREFHGYASLLPDGRHVLFAYGQEGNPSTYGFYVSAIGSRVKTRVAATSSSLDHPNSLYASGQLLWARQQTITARAFDLETLTVEPTGRDVAGPIEAAPNRSAAFSVSQNGVLVYQPMLAHTQSRLTVVDRSGKEVRTLADEGEYSNVELSPDGSRLAVSLPDPTTRMRDIWVVDMARGIRSRLTFDPSDERSAVWSRDGRSLGYTSKGLDLYTRPLGMGAESPLVKDGLSKDPRGWSPDGRYFLYRVTGPETRNDLWIKPLDGDQKPRPFLVTSFDENWAVFAPDGRWVAYASDESGRSEVYVTAFPSAEGKWQISTDGGRFPRWRADGKEIMYLSDEGNVTSVKVDTTGVSPSISPAVGLFKAMVLPLPGTPFDMSADGKLFVVNRAIVSKTPPSLVLVYNWPQLLSGR
jgi:eukaryotic-like serine/threonine-protein kinase